MDGVSGKYLKPDLKNHAIIFLFVNGTPDFSHHCGPSNLADSIPHFGMRRKHLMNTPRRGCYMLLNCITSMFLSS